MSRILSRSESLRKTGALVLPSCLLQDSANQNSVTPFFQVDCLLYQPNLSSSDVSCVCHVCCVYCAAVRCCCVFYSPSLFLSSPRLSHLNRSERDQSLGSRCEPKIKATQGRGLGNGVCKMRHSSFVLFFACLVVSVYGDFGDLCRCSCDESREELTILLPSSYACTTCVAETCRRHFVEQCKLAVQIVTECLNRTSWKYKISIWFYYACLGALFFLMILLDLMPRLSELLEINRKDDDVDLAELPIGPTDDEYILGPAVVNLRRLSTPLTQSISPSHTRAETSTYRATTDAASVGDAWEPFIRRDSPWSSVHGRNS
eukprot:Blabericola_migrator_1__371@NODE_1093_length_5463_cov_81_535211_g748_i0_p3_GENE_NODE_1093_length_5463_cov_81_535211_g748_i0NODE_1093_length_5463_cov_81_535211_g748_i0_p3_ORF_typecomplete_len317_score20_60_NODE_1093_length_5463_cov_81_535211_g748_i034584408